MQPIRNALLLISSFVCAVAAAAPQNALDSGRSRDDRGMQNRQGTGSGSALDANLRRGSGGQNIYNPNEDLAARNLIVTGNVVGGRGFRGSVGYTAPTDFRGLAGSDASFAFRADSAMSSLNFLAGTRSGDRFALAQQYAVLSYRRDTTPTDRAASSGEIPGLFRLDRATSQMNAARVIETAAEPIAFFGGLDRGQRPVEYTVSAVQGLRVRHLDDPFAAAPLTSFERARAREDLAAGRLGFGQPIKLFESPLTEADRMRNEALIQPIVPEGRTESLIAPDRLGATPSDERSAYDEIVRRMLELYADDPNIRIDADAASLERARRDLGMIRSLLEDGNPMQPTPEEETTGETPSTELDPSPKPVQPDAEADRERLPEMVRGLRHGTRVHDLAPGERARVDELVREAQVSLERGDYFRAERSFDSALTLNPGNPLLIAGLANAQLGAGVYLSTALTLRALFTQSPEMIDVRYEARLLPNETRLQLSVDSLRSRLELGVDGPSYGLVLAYVGHQLNNRRLIEEGLNAMTGPAEWERLRDLLKAVWLSE